MSPFWTMSFAKTFPRRPPAVPTAAISSNPLSIRLASFFSCLDRVGADLAKKRLNSARDLDISVRGAIALGFAVWRGRVRYDAAILCQSIFRKSRVRRFAEDGEVSSGDF